MWYKYKLKERKPHLKRTTIDKDFNALLFKGCDLDLWLDVYRYSWPEDNIYEWTIAIRTDDVLMRLTLPGNTSVKEVKKRAREMVKDFFSRKNKRIKKYQAGQK